jgi:hypothetical protein
MWQEGLAEILTHPDYVDEWVGEMASLGMSPDWEHLIRERAPQRPEAVHEEKAGGGPVPAPALRVKTKVNQEEGEPLSTFIQTFRKRVILARVPPEDWLSQLDENLNKKSKKSKRLFWESYNEVETWDQVIPRMLGCVPDRSSLSLRQQIQKCRQFADEDAVEFGHRLKALLEVFKSSTGADYKVAFRTCYLSKIRLNELIKLQTTAAMTDVELFVQARTLQNSLGAGAKTADAKKTSERPKGSEAKADSTEQKKGSADEESKGKRKGTKRGYWVFGDPDHIARNCPKKKVKAQQSVDADVQGLVQGRPAGLLLDTGAEISVVKEAIAKDHPTRSGKLEFHWSGATSAFKSR